MEMTEKQFERLFEGLRLRDEQIKFDAEGLELMEDPMQELRIAEAFAPSINNEKKVRTIFEEHIQNAKAALESGDEETLRIKILLLREIYFGIKEHDLLAAAQKHMQGSPQGGLKAARNRREPRHQLKKKVKEHIAEKGMWNNFSNTIKSITDDLWLDIQESVKNTGEWEGLQIDLKKSKIGRQTIYDAVSETSLY